MSIYFIEAVTDEGTERYVLDATENISISYEGKVTSFPVGDGDESGDHYTLRQPTITYSGGVSDIKTLKAPEEVKSPLDYLEGIKKLREDKVPLKFYFSEDIPPIANCFLETFTFSQNKENGAFRHSEGSVSSFKVNLVAKAVRKVKGAVVTTRRADEIKNETDPKETKVDTTKYEDPEKGPTTFVEKGIAASQLGDTYLSLNPISLLQKGLLP